jgi:hypothetical protein
MPLDRAPDMVPRATEIGDPKLLIHRLLYRQGRMAQLFRDGGDPLPREERKRALEALAGFNRADLYRLEEILDVQTT